MTLQAVSLHDILAGQAAQGHCVVALGTFDGVHRGHMAILAHARDLAARLAVQSVAFTFDCLPLEVLHPQEAPYRITSPYTRVALLAQQVDRVLVAHFDEALASVLPGDFISRVLMQGLKCVGIVAGFNYTFGQGATGKADYLESVAKERGLAVEIVPPIEHHGQQISSSLIRRLISEGDVTKAAHLLGRSFCLEGQVVEGDARGRQLGFPTANVVCDHRLLVPADGVYVTEFWRNKEGTSSQRLGAAVTAISCRPTFGGTNTSIESFVLDYHGDLYGANVGIHFLHRLRGIVRFASGQELRSQISADVAVARELFSSFTPSRLQA